MNDIARLGIALDSRQVTAGVAALDDLTRAAKPAEAATTALGKASTTAATGHTALSNAANKSATGVTALTKQTGLARHELINLSRQVQDVGVSLVSGQSPFMVLVQQGAQVADIFGSSKTGTVGGALKQVGAGIFGFLGPVGLAAAGLAAVGVAGGLAVASVAKTGKAFDDTSRSIGTTLGYLHALETSAAIKGIETPDFLKAMDRFGASVFDAQHGMGGLAEAFRANNTSAKSFSDYLEKAADLIKNAGTDQRRLQMLQEMGLPATMEWVRFLSQGKEGIRAATAEAAKFGDSAEANLVAKARSFDEAWTKGVKNLGTGLRNAVLGGASLLDSLSDKATAFLMKWPGVGQKIPTNILRNALEDRAAGLDVGSRMSAGSDVSGLYAGTGAGAAGAGPKVKTAAERQKEISDKQTYLGLLGQTITAEQAAQQVQLAADAQYLSTGVKVSQTKIAQLQQLAREQNSGVSMLKAQTDALRVDAATVGMSAGATAAYTAEQNLLNAAKQRGTVLSDATRASIAQEATALGQAAAQADLMRSAYTGLVQGPLQTLQSSIAGGSTFFEALKKSGISALNAISSKLMDMAAQGLWGAAFGGSGGGGGGFLSSLLGGSSGSGAAAQSASTLAGNTGGAFYGPGFASGGYTGPGARNKPAGIVHAGEFVMNAAATSRIGVARLNALQGYADGGFVTDRVSMPAGMIRDPGVFAGRGGSNGAANSNTPQNVHVTVGIEMNANGEWQGFVKDISQASAAKTVSATMAHPTFVDRVASASKTARTTRRL